MKMSLAWHKEDLIRKKAQLESMLKDVEQMALEFRILKSQIEIAEKQGKDGFDRKLFLQRRGKK